jgi:phospholipid-binding lipoprotein MlaA
VAKIRKLKPALVLAVLLGGCASDNPDGIYDPFEPMNREVFDFNHSLDKNAALPAASYYKHALPNGLRTGVHNFLSNLSLPITFANDILQGEVTRAGYAVCRLGVNTTVGVLGVMDPAADWGCDAHDEDFGQTLAVYGVPGGPYLVMPLLGSSLPRDMAGKLVVDHYFNPLSYLQYNGKIYVGMGQNVIKAVDQRSRAVGALHEVERTSIDYYAAMRRLYVQRRNSAVTNDTLTAPPPPPDGAPTPAPGSTTPDATPGGTTTAASLPPATVATAAAPALPAGPVLSAAPLAPDAAKK